MCQALAQDHDLMRTPLEGISRDIVMVENSRATRSRVTNMSDHKFKVGQTVHCAVPGLYGRAQRGGVFKIMQRLPPQGGDYQYRIKSANEPYDRVVRESELERAV